MLHLKFTSKPFDRLSSHVAVLSTFSDERPLQGSAAVLDWRLNGRISRVMLANRFEGRPNEALLMPSEGRIYAKEILMIGLGERQNFSESSLLGFIQTLLNVLSKKHTGEFLVSFSELVPNQFDWRNSIRFLVSKLHDHPGIERVVLAENEERIKEAKRRHMDFGLNVDVSFETLGG